MQNIKKLVYHSLISCEENGRYSNLELNSVIKYKDLSQDERSLFTALFYGVIERRITLDYQIAKLSKRPIQKLDTAVMTLLRIGLYQILYMTSIPDHAAINETVEIAKSIVNRGAVGYINGILRSAKRIIKSNDTLNLFTPDQAKDVCGFLSITYGYPRYLCKLWVKSYGKEIAEKIMISLNSRHQTVLQVNLLKISRADFIDKLIKLGYDAKPSSLTDTGVILRSGTVSSLPGFDDGLFFVQDDASALAVYDLAPMSGENILDVCACPGGKSFYSAIMMNNVGKIISSDIHENKLSLITSGASRLGLDIISTRCTDASVYDPAFENSADRVICDVPCSGFGTISKKPDLRHKQQSDISSLPELQYSILQTSARYLKNGGTLMYSTCTLNPAENEDNVNRFLSENSNFTLIKMVTNLPCETGSDGFFHALLKKS